MNATNEHSPDENLAFFGRVNASISHELKNVMAIISETAGLLNDLNRLASSGRPIDPEMLRLCTESIIEEIHRGFGVIRQMNRFAHSVDHASGEVDLNEVTRLMVTLAGFLSFAGKTRIRPCENEPPTVWTRPVLLEKLLYELLVLIYRCGGPETRLVIEVHAPTALARQIVVTGCGSSFFEALANAPLDTLAAAVQVVLTKNPEADRVELEIPSRMETATK